jgi:hypothetical protein
MGWYYNVTNNSTPPTPNDYDWFGTNTSNQEAAYIYIGGTYAITKIRVYASARSSAVLCRLCMWAENTYVLTQSDSFSMAAGSESVGGQAWQEITLPTPLVVTAGNYYVGLYRNPTGAHIAGTNTAVDSYRKTNTNGFPSLVSMSGYSQDTGEGLLVGVFVTGAPTAPSSLTATRNSDTSISLSFTNNASEDNPYTSVKVQRYDNVTGTYYEIATLSGSATSFTDTTVIANRKYKYAINAYNYVAYSAFTYSDYVNTTPAAPSNVVAASSGTSVNITWTDNSSNENHFYIQSSEYSGGTWQSWVNEVEVATGTTSWTDTTPPSIVKYRVKSLTDEYGNLSSAYVESNELTILQAPSAPTNLSPDNQFFDGADEKIFTWQHNPLDGSTQTKYSIQYKVSGGSYPGTPQVNETASSTSSHTFAAETFSSSTIYKYQVKTWGAYSTGSAWSTEKQFACYAKPIGTITSPTVADDYASSFLTMTWSFTGVAQTEFLAKLYDNNDVLLETQSVASSAETVNFTTQLSNLATYTVTLQVKDSTNLWSLETETEFNTVFAVPPTPTIVLTEDTVNGLVNIAITNPSPEGAEIEAVTNNVYRSLDGGTTYELILEDIPLNTTVVDYVPNIGGTTYYYVDSVSATPTIASSVASYVTINMTGDYIFNTGNNFENYLVMTGDINFGEKINPDITLNKFEGRTYPVKFTGTSINQNISFGCDLLFTDYDTMTSIINSTNDIVFRDWKNRWFYCAITNSNFNKKDHEAYQFSCEIIRVEGGDS